MITKPSPLSPICRSTTTPSVHTCPSSPRRNGRSIGVVDLVKKLDLAFVKTGPSVCYPVVAPNRGPFSSSGLASTRNFDGHRPRVRLAQASMLEVLTNFLTNRNYLLAQAHVDASALSNSIAHLNTSTTFSPLQPLQDTDVAGYLRIAHEQNLISTIEEGRKETQEAFYRVLEDRSQRDWEAKKKRVFEELGGRVASADRGMSDIRSNTLGKSTVRSSCLREVIR